MQTFLRNVYSTTVLTDVTNMVTNMATGTYRLTESSCDSKENQNKTQNKNWFQPKSKPEPQKPRLLSTSLIKFDALKIEINKRCAIEYPISTLEKNKKPGGQYSTMKLREAISKMLYSVDYLTDDRWSLIRSLAKSIREIPTGHSFQKLIDKAKVYDDRELEYTLAIAVFLKLKYPTKFPSLNQTTFDRVKSWLKDEYPHINVIEVSFPTFSVSRYAQEIALYCPWFSPKTIDNPNLKKELISYGNLQELLKKTFYGYSPTPQYLGKLGFDCPQTRKYSLQDYYKIRLAIIESRRRRNKPDNYMIFEELSTNILVDIF